MRGSARMPRLGRAPPARSRVPQQQPREQRGAQGGRDGADRQLRRGKRGPRERVRRDEQRRSGKRGDRQQDALVVAGHRSRGMRDEQSDEADHPGEGHGGSRQEGSREEDEALGSLRVHAERRGVLLSKGEEIQARSGEEEHGARSDRVGKERERFSGRRVGEAPHHPEEHRPRRLAGRGREDEQNHRGKEGVGDETREQQPLKIEPAAPPCQSGNTEGGHNGSRESGGRGEKRRETGQGGDCCSRRGSARSAEKKGIRERILEQRLQRRARQRQAAAHDRRQSHTRESKRREKPGGLAARSLSRQKIGEGKMDASDRDPEDDRKRQQKRREEHASGPPASQRASSPASFSRASKILGPGRVRTDSSMRTTRAAAAAPRERGPVANARS